MDPRGTLDPLRAPTERAPLITLLHAAGLPTDDLDALDLDAFRIVGSSEAPTALIALQACGDAGLLRSLVVAPDARGTGLADRLVEDLVARARNAGLRELWLLTETAEAFFAARGFRRAPRSSSPEAIRATAEFDALCPDSAACMVRPL